MEATFNLPVTINYWDLVKNLSNDAKKALINALQRSMEEEKKKNSSLTLIEELSAPWPDDGLTADEFVQICESGRNNQRDILDF